MSFPSMAAMPKPRHIHLDAVGGVAGDMFVAALLDAFPSLRERVMADLAAIMPPDCGRPTLTEGSSCGIAAHRFALVAGDGSAVRAERKGHHHHDHEHGHDHDHDHDHHHGDGHHHHEPEACSFEALVRRIARVPLSEGTSEQAIAILRVVAEAESKIHQCPLKDVHFHELADWDSLMDVVAAGSIIAALPGVVWSVSDLPQGRGLVKTSHGLLPVPAPATAEILTGFCFRDDGVAGERVTPTGAAIVAHVVSRPGSGRPGGRLLATGTGAGTRDLPGMPNILRALVFSSEGENGDVAVLSFDVDDMTGEEIGVAIDRLRLCPGVIDVTTGARMGKKGRPTTDFRLLVQGEELETVRDQCFTQTTTIGLRWRFERRACLERRYSHSVVDHRRVPVKTVHRPGAEVTRKAESDDVARLDSLAQRRRLKALAEQEEE